MKIMNRKSRSGRVQTRNVVGIRVPGRVLDFI